MGLLDLLTGMRNGPRGHGGGGGMSPITMALLGLLAYKAVKSFGGAGPRAGSGMATPGGGLGDLLKGGLAGGGLGGLGGILSGGLGDSSSNSRTRARVTSPTGGSAPGRTNPSRLPISARC